MAISASNSYEIAGEHITARVQPKIPYSNACLRIRGRGFDFKLYADDEQLAEIGYAIQQHLEQSRAHETPDQAKIYQHELDQTIEEEANETYRAS